jgi:hypothetical protein
MIVLNLKRLENTGPLHTLWRHPDKRLLREQVNIVLAMAFVVVKEKNHSNRH